MTKSLDGKVIQQVRIADDKKAILFVTDKGEVIAKCDGDCCSSTWIEHLSLPAYGLPARVISVENLNMPDLGSPDECDVIAYYGCKIVTDKGDLVIDYRNESNGYYGGGLSWPDGSYFYGGVYGQNVSTQQWQDVNEDI